MRIRNVLIVAGRELRQIVRARSFWITLLILPIIVGATTYGSGRVGREGEIRVALIGSPSVLLEVSSILRTPATNAEGGLSTSQQPRIKIVAQLPERSSASPTVPPEGRRTIATRLDRDEVYPMDAIAKITTDPVSKPRLEIWTTDDAHDVGARLATAITDRLVPDRSGIKLQDRSQLWKVDINRTQQSAGRRRDGRSAAPTMLLAYLLLVTLLATGSWMLQGTVEERSNKLLEAILTCVSGTELMLGKLAGGLAAALGVVSAWMAGSMLLVVALVRADLVVVPEAFHRSLEITPVGGLGTVGGALALTFFFVAGLVMMSAVFLAIGALSGSVREAQGFLSPVILSIVLPLGMLARPLLSGAPSHAADVMTWIPVYTPFLMMARIGSGAEALETCLAAVLVVVFVLGELMLLRRIFTHHLLASHPGPLAALRRVVGWSHEARLANSLPRSRE